MPIMPTRQVVLSALFGVALAATPASPALAQDKGQDEKKNLPHPAEVRRTLDQIPKDIKGLQEFRKNLEDEVFGKQNATALGEMGLLRRLTDMEARIKRIEETLNIISARLGEPGRSTSAFGPTLPPATLGRSFVRIVNDYPTEVSMLVNGRSQRLLPSQTLTVEVPAGSYTYELLHAGARPTTSAIKDGETVTLRVR
jgi:hypothetical protein